MNNDRICCICTNLQLTLQVKIDNEWIILAADQSEKIEEDYCAVKVDSVIQQLVCIMFFVLLQSFFLYQARK